MSRGKADSAPAQSTYLTGIIAQLPEGCQRLWEQHSDVMLTAPGSASKHQAWPGGYQDHLVETMRLAEGMYQQLNDRRSLPFSLRSAQLVLFLHDLEKPFKYGDKEIFPDHPGLAKSDPEKFKELVMRTYEIKLDQEQSNALKYIHGEGDDYQEQRVMGPLATLCHCCDIISARLWPDQPLASEAGFE